MSQPEPSIPNWSNLGAVLRAEARRMAEDNCVDMPHITTAYLFLVENPWCFQPDYESDSWPFDMPTEPPAALVAAYYQITLRHAELWLAAHSERRAA